MTTPRITFADSPLAAPDVLEPGFGFVDTSDGPVVIDLPTTPLTRWSIGATILKLTADDNPITVAPPALARVNALELGEELVLPGSDAPSPTEVLRWIVRFSGVPGLWIVRAG